MRSPRPHVPRCRCRHCGAGVSPICCARHCDESSAPLTGLCGVHFAALTPGHRQLLRSTYHWGGKPSTERRKALAAAVKAAALFDAAAAVPSLRTAQQTTMFEATP